MSTRRKEVSALLFAIAVTLLTGWAPRAMAGEADEDARVAEFVGTRTFHTAQQGAKSGELVPYPNATLSPMAREVMEKTNRDRCAMFASMASTLKTEESKVRENFAQYRAVIETEIEKRTKESDTVILEISAVPSAVDRLLPELLSSFLVSMGYDQPEKKSAGSGDFKMVARKHMEFGADSISVHRRSANQALDDLAKGRCHLAIISRPPKAQENMWFTQEKSANLTLPSYSTIFASEALSVVASGKDSESVVFLSDLREWMTGKRIRVCSGASSEAAEIEEILADRLNVSPNEATGAKKTKECATMGAVAQMVESTPDSFAVIPASDAPAAKTLRVASSPYNAYGLSPQRIYVRSEDYPLIRQWQLCMTRNRPVLAKQLRDYITGAGQAIIKANHLVDHGLADDSERQDWLREADEIRKRYSRNEFSKYRDLIAGCNRADTPFVVHFESKKDSLELYSNVSPNALPRIRSLVQDLARHAPDATLVLIGHTDGDGSDAYNKTLGFARAKSLREELIAMGLKVDPVTADNSMGKMIPIARNDTEEGKALNRRVEIWVRSRPDPKR